MEWVKRNIIWLVIIILFIIILFKRDGCRPREVKILRDTVSVTLRDTQWMASPTVYVPVYTPKEDTVYITKEKPVPSQDYNELRVQYVELFDKYYGTSVYTDKISLKDSSGKDVGLVNVKDEISKNKIANRRVDYQLTFPTITNTTTTTITNTIPEEKKNKVFLGGGIQGNKNQIVDAFQAGLLLQNKKDRIFGVGINQPFTGTTSYYVTTYWKLSFKNRNN